jgi:hypothetical protein
MEVKRSNQMMVEEWRLVLEEDSPKSALICADGLLIAYGCTDDSDRSPQRQNQCPKLNFGLLGRIIVSARSPVDVCDGRDLATALFSACSIISLSNQTMSRHSLFSPSILPCQPINPRCMLRILADHFPLCINSLCKTLVFYLTFFITGSPIPWRPHITCLLASGTLFSNNVNSRTPL